MYVCESYFSTVNLVLKLGKRMYGENLDSPVKIKIRT